ncbi:merozoite surface protein 3b [Yersinia alsatica]|uniref:merozoite surface protein 3b n=1 Tax=Yersinia alsatica TaxID=2890317 RepID=UPI00119D887E|nr:merozoite surface protein 3b [Yersinia alsatica]
MNNMLASYTSQAIQKLQKLGIVLSPESDAPILTLLDAIADLDTNRVMAIGRTLQQQSAFNEVVRDNIANMDVANRQGKIVAAFDSIREDATQMVGWLEDGKLDVIERIKSGWMTLRRGSIPDRFNDIKKTYLDVAKASNEQISREKAILDAYQDFRFGLKQAHADAQTVLSIAQDNLQNSRVLLQQTQGATEQYQGGDAAELSRLELIRDESIRAMQKEDERYQIVKDLTDNLLIAYNAAEAVFARLQQTNAIKERVYRQSVTFFSTNEIVFTALSASMTSLQGLSESTQTLEAMKTGINDSLTTIATQGNQQLEDGLRAGYGSTIKADSVRALVNAIVSFQESSYRMIDELRTEATNNANELASVVEEGKRRFADVVTKAEVSR